MTLLPVTRREMPIDDVARVQSELQDMATPTQQSSESLQQKGHYHVATGQNV